MVVEVPVVAFPDFGEGDGLAALGRRVVDLLCGGELLGLVAAEAASEPVDGVVGLGDGAVGVEFEFGEQVAVVVADQVQVVAVSAS